MGAHAGKEWELGSQQKCAVVSDGASGNAHKSLRKAFAAVCEEFSGSYYQHRNDIYQADFDCSLC